MTAPTFNTAAVLDEVAAERLRQFAKHGDQTRVPDGTGGAVRQVMAARARQDCQLAFRADRGTWLHILGEEVAEALAESDPARLRAELIQVAATAVQWAEAIDARAEASR